MQMLSVNDIFFYFYFFYKVLFLNKMAGNINLNRAIQIIINKTLSNKTRKKKKFQTQLHYDNKSKTNRRSHIGITAAVKKNNNNNK